MKTVLKYLSLFLFFILLSCINDTTDDGDGNTDIGQHESSDDSGDLTSSSSELMSDAQNSSDDDSDESSDSETSSETDPAMSSNPDVSSKEPQSSDTEPSSEEPMSSEEEQSSETKISSEEKSSSSESMSSDTDLSSDEPMSSTTIDPDSEAGTCGEGGPQDSRDTHYQYLDEDETIYYIVGAPETDEPLPLVMVFHGDEGSPEAATLSIWRRFWRESQEFIVVWAKCPNCESWYKGDTEKNRDYVWDVLNDVAGKYNVNVNRMYSIGFSGGSVFMGMYGFEFQHVFAGIQWHCGGGGWSYDDAPREECKVDGHIVLAEDDYLWDSAKRQEKVLLDNGHVADFVVADCSGHCCHTDDMQVGAWEWFKERTKCDGIVTGECADLTDLP